jgi:hypothetical protein
MKTVQMVIAMALMLLAAVLLSEIYASESQMFFGDRKQIFLLGGSLFLVSHAALFVLWNTKTPGLSWRSFLEVPIVTACWMALLHFTGNYVGADAFWDSSLFGGSQTVQDPLGLSAMIIIATIGAGLLNFLFLSRETNLLRKKNVVSKSEEPERLKPTDESKGTKEPSESSKAIEPPSVKALESTPLPKEVEPKVKPEPSRPAAEKVSVKLATTEAENPFVWTVR